MELEAEKKSVIHEFLFYITESNSEPSPEFTMELSFMNFCFMLQRVIQNPVLHLRWSLLGNSFMALCC